MPEGYLAEWRHDTQINDIQHKGLLIDIQHNNTAIMLNDVVLSVTFYLLSRISCCHDECLYTDFHYAECHYVECHYADCHYAECCGAIGMTLIMTLSRMVCSPFCWILYPFMYCYSAACQYA
jgi:hypothetical protein